MESNVIAVRGAREHNLRGVDVDIPKHKLVVITGVSGSGKSSLAFDTLYAEGQRRYVESLSSYARQFLGQLSKPAYDSIRGLSPTIAIEQKTSSMNPRSTVGTVTDIYDYMRVLFARAGVPHCPRCDAVVVRQTISEMVETILARPEGTRLTLLAPVVQGKEGGFGALFTEVQREGFARVRLDGQVVDLAALRGEGRVVDESQAHTIEVVVDRIKVREGARARVTDSVETAARVGEGRVIIAPADGSPDDKLSEFMRCEACDLDLPDLTPQLFSFNSPLGMCQSCRGLGRTMECDQDKLVPDRQLSLDDGAVRPWATALGEQGAGSLTADILEAVIKRFRIRRDVPWSKLTERQRRILLYGADKPIKFKSKRGYGMVSFELPFEGVARSIERRWRETKSDAMRQQYQQYMSDHRCRDCGGSRLRPGARAVTVGPHTLPSLVGATVEDLNAVFAGLELEGSAAMIAGELVREITARLRFLVGVGLGYLSLERAAGTLSGGESQRIRLASQIGTELTGVLYVLDEPTIGLHSRDNSRLIEALERLRDIGNSVVVVEHDAAIMRAADWVIDMGPGAGNKGGYIVARGSAADLESQPGSLTGQYLAGTRRIPTPETRRKASAWIQVTGARENNLANIDVKIPLGVFVVVTGVSGAGKSSLVAGIVEPALRHKIHGSAVHVGAHDELLGLEQLDKIITIDQRPIGRSPRSNPATYTKLFDEIRVLYSKTRESRMYGYGPGRFSFNVKGGRCEACAGDGVKKVEMHFLADVYVTCDVCGGRRFNEATLRVTYGGLNIAEVLELSVTEALVLFQNHIKARRILQTLSDVGLGYVTLGQSSTTLSGGEAQRVKLSRELARVQTGRTLYVLDEPSTGLHFRDIERLMGVIQRLVDAGNTVLTVEHNLDIIKTADWVIDLGPDGGAGGGGVVACGAPEEVAAQDGGHTGRYLREVLAPAP